jgi:hypothetical protein
MPENRGVGASKQYEALLGTHEQYQNLNARWRFLLNSFLGGEIYRQGQYLTRYANESEMDYITRMWTTPLDNHCKGVLAVYNAFLFRKPPIRDFASIEGDPMLADFLEDANLEGQDFDSFMKDVSTYSGVFGHVWCVVSKPNVGAVTRADEMIIGARPYVSLITPLAALDWEWERQPAGNYVLKYFKYMEDSDRSHIFTIKEWYPDRIVTSIVNKEDQMIESQAEEVNGLGFIPIVICYSQRSVKRGIGVSEIDDIADIQRAIYNEYSEIEQTIRISGHPSLVKTPDTEAVAGAGAIIQIPDTLDSGLKPYLLEPSGQNVDSIYKSIDKRVDAIDRMANLGSARAVKTSAALSGIAMETEFQMLNARLSDKADNLELAEINIWKIWCWYEGKEWDGMVEYPDTFQIQDKQKELTSLVQAKAAVTDPEYQKMLEYEIMSTSLGDEDLTNYLKDPMMYAPPMAQPQMVNEVQQAALGLTQQQSGQGTTNE